jgi:hypothetical protein
MTDILADLAGMQKRRGVPCARARIQSEHPDLLEPFDTALSSLYPAQTVADWFVQHGVPYVTRQVIQNHRSAVCERCRQTS